MTKKTSRLEQRLRSAFQKAVDEQLEEVAGDPHRYIQGLLSDFRGDLKELLRTRLFDALGVDTRWGRAELKEGPLADMLRDKFAAHFAEDIDEILAGVAITPKMRRELQKEASEVYADELMRRVVARAKERAAAVIDAEIDAFFTPDE